MRPGRCTSDKPVVTLTTILASIVSLSTVTAQEHVAGQPTGSSDASVTPPLFASEALLTLTIEAPLKQIFKERKQESAYHPAALSYIDASGSAVRLDVRVKTRGKSRLLKQVCSFPPLRLNFKKKQVHNTVFDGQNKLKLVTHCQNNRKYEQLVLQEYLLYRTYNLITDLSYRVRLARITYVDAEKSDSLTKYAFFIEDEDAMAERNGWIAVKAPLIQPEYIDAGQLALVELFHFMIGSTDFSVFLPEPDKSHCCHNSTPVGTTLGPVFPVPFDLDMTGVVNPPYGRPSPKARIRSLVERQFWGICRPLSELNAARARFNEQRDSIYALYQSQPYLEDRSLEWTITYFDDFYAIINDERKVARMMERDCRDVSPAFGYQ